MSGSLGRGLSMTTAMGVYLFLILEYSSIKVVWVSIVVCGSWLNSFKNLIIYVQDLIYPNDM